MDLNRRVVLVTFGLVALVFIVFGQTASFQFVNYDDKTYVYENPIVQQGLTWKGFLWSWTFGEIGHWHPLTWLTHMADCQFYGLWAGGHHLTNVVCHAAAVVLLFLVLNAMTGALWRSAGVAAIFAIHPLRAESVAWVAERKDVLSGVFFMATVGAYWRYTRQPSAGRYAVVAAVFALGLLCKNMLVTTPFVLLLLDWWPLRRWRKPLWPVVREKIPLLLLSLASCVATFLVPEKVGEVEHVPLLERLGNAVVSYGIYLRQMVYPANLAIPYLYPAHGVPGGQIVAACLVLTGISALVFGARQERPYLLVGWLWFLGMLVPAIGLVQISYYSHADRYTYLPGIGLILAVTWLMADWSAGWRHRRAGLGALAVVVIGPLTVMAWNQTRHWKDDEALWTHTILCTSSNYLAHYNLAGNFSRHGRYSEAIDEYQEVLAINPSYRDSYIKDTHVNLGIALFQSGQVEEGVAELRRAVAIDPGFAQAHNNLGNALMQTGHVAAAIPEFQAALKIDSNYANAHANLASALSRMGQPAAACAQFQHALQIEPNDATTQNNLAWLLATCPDARVRDGNQAVKLAERANQSARGENPFFLSTLAAAYAEAGQFSKAIATAQNGAQLAQDQSRTRLAASILAELKLYQAGRPCHDFGRSQ